MDMEHTSEDTIVLNNRLEIINKKIVWEIDNFSVRLQQSEEIHKSPKFEIVCPNGDKQKWSFGMNPTGTTRSKDVCQTWVHIELEECNNTEEEKGVLAKATFTIVNCAGEEKYRQEVDVQKYVVGSLAYVRWSIKRDFCGLLSNDRLTIICYLEIFQPIETVKRNDIQIPNCLAVDMENLRKNEASADCVLMVTSDAKEFKAHKLILASRSPVFAAMFVDGMVEAQTNRVQIADIQADIVDQMLQFIYTGTVPNLEGVAKELLVAADKYEILGLKLRCEHSLAFSLCKENVCEFLLLADRHSAAHLKSEAFQFIKANANEVISSDGWKIFSKEYPHLVVPIFEAVMASQSVKSVAGW